MCTRTTEQPESTPREQPRWWLSGGIISGWSSRVYLLASVCSIEACCLVPPAAAAEARLQWLFCVFLLVSPCDSQLTICCKWRTQLLATPNEHVQEARVASGTMAPLSVVCPHMSILTTWSNEGLSSGVKAQHMCMSVIQLSRPLNAAVSLPGSSR